MTIPTFPMRACNVCVHGTTASGISTVRGVRTIETVSTCWHPDVTRGRGPQPCAETRANTGQCGLEARLLRIKGE